LDLDDDSSNSDEEADVDKEATNEVILWTS
jgi:hypothetical protein